LAARRGARVLATASGRRARDLVRRLGADAVIDARRDDARTCLRELAPDGVDAVLALAGGDGLERLLDSVPAETPVAFPNGIEPRPPRRRRSIQRMAYDLDVDARWFRRLARSVADAAIQVPLAAVLPLAQAARAHELLAQGHVLGRIVLRVRGG
jgi:NADPH:quinone reductase-like Zn-dependent oxidoreductase